MHISWKRFAPGSTGGWGSVIADGLAVHGRLDLQTL